jgi:mRNA interferase HigB
VGLNLKVLRNYTTMELIGKEILDAFRSKHSDARSQIDSWVAEVENCQWKTPHDVGRRFKADFPGNQQVIFDICRNKYRLWVKVAYKTGIVIMKAIGTHKEYEKWEIE